MNKPSQLLNAAQEKSRSVDRWADLWNFLFDPEEGLVAKAYPTRAERAAFVQTPEYKAIRKLISETRQRTGLVNGATPKEKSGRFVVRLPKSMHAALEQEAAHEGVSLNQLVVAKLACQLETLVGRE
jgi:hypothetical protein